MFLPDAVDGEEPPPPLLPGTGAAGGGYLDSPSCQLLGPTALVVQALMGVLVLLSLLYKRHRENPTRPWRIWLFDVSKQVVGQMFVHGVNVLISGIISELTDRNACVFYFLNILIDTTLGVALIYGVLHATSYVLSEKFGLKGFESGVYGSPPSFNYWFRQASTYVFALMVMKFVVIGLFVLFPAIFTFGDWLLSWTRQGDGDALQVIFVMGIFPIAMNVLQFWLIDSIVKASSGASALSLDLNAVDPLNQADREPLFNASNDDDDDDTHHGHSDIENQLSHQHSFNSGHTSGTKSYATGITTPDIDDSKSSIRSGEETHQEHDHTYSHAYPPSLSSSYASTSLGSNPSSLVQSDRRSVTPPKEAKNLLKQANRRKTPSPLQLEPDGHHSRARTPPGGVVRQKTSRPTTPQPVAVAVAPAVVLPKESHAAHPDTEWAVDWDDDGEDWGGHAPPASDVKVQQNKPVGADPWDNAGVNATRTRRLS